MKDCLFCDIVIGFIPSEKVYEDEYGYAFRDINPQAPTHVLIVPRKHIESLADMSEENMEIISGLDLIKSIYSGCPGAFVGIGNCLITTRKDGKADVTYVGEDTHLSLPVLGEFPAEPSIGETVHFLNHLSKTELAISRDEPSVKNDNE